MYQGIRNISFSDIIAYVITGWSQCLFILHYWCQVIDISLTAISVHSQEISILETKVKGIREKSVSLEWTLKKGKEFGKINIIEIFRGEAAKNDDSNLIIRERSPENYAKKLFGNRLLPADIIGNRAADNKIIYKITLTDLQYSDTGFFFLRAKFEDKFLYQQLVNSTVSLKVEGRLCMFQKFYRKIVENSRAKEKSMTWWFQIYKFFYKKSRLRVTLVRSSRPEMFYEKTALENCPIFTVKHLCWCLFLIKLQAFRSAMLLRRNFSRSVFLWISWNF